MEALEFALVFILALLAGGWAIAAGVLFGLDPWVVYFAAVLGSVSFTLTLLFLLGRHRDRVVDRFFPDAEERVRGSRAGEIVGRWGEIGLATIGGLLLGPSLTLTAALIMGVDRRRFTIWFLISTVVGFALLTLFWVAVVG